MERRNLVQRLAASACGAALPTLFKPDALDDVRRASRRLVGTATESFLLLLALGSLPVAGAEGQSVAGPDTVVVRSGMLKLRAVLWRPAGRGAFPAVLFNHGSGHAAGVADGRRDQRHPDVMGPVFARHGYVLLYLFRRGDGLSVGQGTPSGDLMDRELAAHGQAARNRLQIRLLEIDEMRDALAGVAYLRARPEVDSRRIAIVGVSFGATLSVLLAERDSTVRATVAFAIGGYSWERSPELRALLLAAVGRTAAPVFFIHAANDYSVAPAKVLGAEMARLGKPHRVRIYPAVGRTPEEGHAFSDLRVPTWEPDVFAFLDEYLRERRGGS